MSELAELKKKIPTQVAVLGGGSWATALVKILSENNVKIKWWIRRKSDVEFIRKYNLNPSYLTDVAINPRRVKTYSKMVDALAGVEYIILAVPAAFIPSTLKDLNKKHFEGKKVVSAIKGMIPEENLLVTDWMERAFNLPLGQTCVIAGPCHAEEVAAEKLSYLTVAANTIAVAEIVKSYLEGEFIRVWCSADLIGAEYSAVMKNIYAIGAGIAHGLGYGDNFLALYTSCAIREMKLFLQAIEPAERDVDEAAYLGDLLVTCYSQFSRNRTFGNMLGKGYSVKAAQLEMNMIAEGYYASNLIYHQSPKRNLQLPIADSVYRIIYENANAKKTFKLLSDQNLH